MMAYSSIFIDTWGWVSLGHRRDNYHPAVKQVYEQMRAAQSPIHTSDYVLDEVMTLLFKRENFQEAVRFMEGIFAAVELGQVQVHRVTSEYFSSAWKLRKKFQDKPLISFTDLTSMAIMQAQDIQFVLTQDEHFIQVGMGFVRVP
ncbi:MAG: PIN domain-containing protein [Leptolyngbyaceae cyanobacterium CRU_2_3]|nr:PIN domain-containing protein [Leptolyngbyaceae cyanobacterium CRU_2_3]